MIKDLRLIEDLDSKAMSGVRGGFSSLLSWFSPIERDIKSAKDKVDDDQSQVQFQIQ
jgi:hypothetical protein